MKKSDLGGSKARNERFDKERQPEDDMFMRVSPNEEIWPWGSNARCERFDEEM